MTTIPGIIIGDCRAVLPTLDAGVFDTCITSPPYWNLRDYNVDGQIGLEQTPDDFVDELVAVFGEVRRVLRDDGTLWLNLGDTYASKGIGRRAEGFNARWHGKHYSTEKQKDSDRVRPARRGVPGLSPKNLLGMPWRVALALQADGWILRSDVVWHKPNPMPEPVTDRPTRAHEFVFLFAKSERYYYNADAIREPLAAKTLTTFGAGVKSKGNDVGGNVKSDNWARSVAERAPRRNEDGSHAGANKRDVWTVASDPIPDAHFATFPAALITPCIRASARPGGRVLDPFAGAATVGVVAIEHGCGFTGIEINPAYAAMGERRIRAQQPGLALGGTV